MVRGSRGRGLEGDAHAGPEPLVAAGDDELAGLESAADFDVSLDGGAQRDLDRPDGAGRPSRARGGTGAAGAPSIT